MGKILERQQSERRLTASSGASRTWKYEELGLSAVPVLSLGSFLLLASERRRRKKKQEKKERRKGLTLNGTLLTCRTGFLGLINNL